MQGDIIVKFDRTEGVMVMMICWINCKYYEIQERRLRQLLQEEPLLEYEEKYLEADSRHQTGQ